MLRFSDSIDNNEGKGEIADYQHFLLFFYKFLPLDSIYTGIRW